MFKISNGNPGFIESPPDSRDFLLGKVQAPIEIPDEYFTGISKLKIRNQNGQPSCVSEATCKMLELMEFWETKSYKILSPRFLYALAKEHDGLQNQEGTYYRQCLKEASEYGICKEVLFKSDVELPKDTYKDFDYISEEAKSEAEHRKIKSYARVDDTSFEGLKQAIYQNKVIVLGLRYSSAWVRNKLGEYSYKESDILPLRVGQWISGHAVLAYGYDKDYIYFLNSFGENWGRNGIGYFGKDYLIAGGFVEAWTAIDLPNNVIENLKEQITLLQKIVDLYKLLIWRAKVGKQFMQF